MRCELSDNVPLGFMFAERMPRPEHIGNDPSLMAAYATTTWSTSTPDGPDNPTEDTER